MMSNAEMIWQPGSKQGVMPASEEVGPREQRVLELTTLSTSSEPSPMSGHLYSHALVYLIAAILIMMGATFALGAQLALW